MKSSVVMATYNGEKYIEEQLQSIVRQTVAADEIIIVDDCSTDKTVKIIQSFQKNNDRIKLYCNPINWGYKENFRKGLSLASGEYIFLSDQDDVWVADKIEKILSVFKETDVDVVCSQYDFIDANGVKIEHPETFQVNGSLQRGHGLYQKISSTKLVLRNEFPGCTCCMSQNVKENFLKIKSDLVHDRAVLLLGSFLNGTMFYNQVTVQYRLHENNCIGVKKRTRKLMLRFGELKKIIMPCKTSVFLFLKEARKTVEIKYFWWYHVLCQLQIPYLYHVFKIR